MRRTATFGMAALLALALTLAWWTSSPPDYIQAAEPYHMGEMSPALASVKAPSDDIAAAQIMGRAMPGHDDVLVQENLGRAFITGRDGWIWKLDLVSGQAERFAQVPLVPSGARFVPGDPDRLLFCSSELYGFHPSQYGRPGVYELKISTKEVRPVALQVPEIPALYSGSEKGAVYPLGSSRMAVQSMTSANSRPIAFCNDIDVSLDGQRIYMSEPFAYPGAGMGESGFNEAVTLARNGRLWMFDLKHQTAQLIAQGYNFVDGILVDRGSEDANGVERSVVITETTKFRLLRLFLSGPQAGTSEILQEALPGMPDGLDRDEQGHLYVALYKPRSKLMTWMHAHPWLKPLVLRLPHQLFPVPHDTGYMVLDASGKKPLYFAMHDGHTVRDISKVIPGRDGIWLSSFDPANHGVHRVSYPAGLQGKSPASESTQPVQSKP